MVESVVVYCASSTKVDDAYLEAGNRLGQLLVENNITCINGGGSQGLMGALNDSVIQSGGSVKGIIPGFMVDAGWCHEQLNETVVTATMHERKEKMAHAADAVIAMPGGLGTLEELAEIITWKQLGLYKNPIVILNINNYYEPLLTFFEKMIEEKFMDKAYRKSWHVASTPEEAIELLPNYPEMELSFSKYQEKEL